MIFDDEELRELNAKAKGGRPLREVKGPTDHSAAMVDALRGVTKAIEEAASRQPVAPHVTVAAPEVNVEAPSVTVEAPKQPRKWRVEVTGRDQEKRIKTMTIEAAD